MVFRRLLADLDGVATKTARASSPRKLIPRLLPVSAPPRTRVGVCGIDFGRALTRKHDDAIHHGE